MARQNHNDRIVQSFVKKHQRFHRTKRLKNPATLPESHFLVQSVVSKRGQCAKTSNADKKKGAKLLVKEQTCAKLERHEKRLANKRKTRNIKRDRDRKQNENFDHCSALVESELIQHSRGNENPESASEPLYICVNDAEERRCFLSEYMLIY